MVEFLGDFVRGSLEGGPADSIRAKALETPP